MQISEILLRNSQFPIVSNVKPTQLSEASLANQEVMTVLANFAYYGYTPSIDGISHLLSMNKDQLAFLWDSVETGLKSITGDKFKVADHVLYKNFPNEVLAMDEAEYWGRQILVYLGFPFETVAQEKEERKAISSELKLKVLEPARSVSPVFNSLISQKTRWTSLEKEMFDALVWEHAIHESPNVSDFLNLSSYGFKENGINAIVLFYEKESMIDSKNENRSNFISKEQIDALNKLKASIGSKNKDTSKSPLACVTIKDATDVLRLALVLSDSDVRFTQAKFRNFSRKDRRAFLSMLEESSNLFADVSERPYFFKKFLKKLHPGDFKNKYPSAKKAYHLIYNDKTVSFNANLESKIATCDTEALLVASQRPGVYARKLHELYSVFGSKAVEVFKDIVGQLDNQQLLKLKRYIATINDRKTLMYPPKGNWNRVQIVNNEKVGFTLRDKMSLLTIINTELSERLVDAYGSTFNVDIKLKNVKIPTNDQDLGDYGRGTVFDIPENIGFIRTSTYWNSSRSSFVDNTWNFYDEDFNPLDVCCWNSEKAVRGNTTYSVFSGDAVNRESGKAAQLIDLYFDKMAESGVRYAVWSVLSYSNILFSDFDELHAGMQFGESAIEGKLFEPSRISMSFELKDAALTKIVAYVDIKERKVVFMDVNMKLSTQSGGNNSTKIQEFMPPYIEYMNALPSYYDLLSTAHDEQGAPAVYDSADITINDEEETSFLAFVHSNTLLKGERLKIEKFLQ